MVDVVAINIKTKFMKETLKEAVRLHVIEYEPLAPSELQLFAELQHDIVFKYPLCPYKLLKPQVQVVAHA